MPGRPEGCPVVRCAGALLRVPWTMAAFEPTSRRSLRRDGRPATIPCPRRVRRRAHPTTGTASRPTPPGPLGCRRARHPRACEAKATTSPTRDVHREASRPARSLGVPRTFVARRERAVRPANTSAATRGRGDFGNGCNPLCIRREHCEPRRRESAESSIWRSRAGVEPALSDVLRRGIRREISLSTIREASRNRTSFSRSSDERSITRLAHAPCPFKSGGDESRGDVFACCLYTTLVLLGVGPGSRVRNRTGSSTLRGCNPHRHSPPVTRRGLEPRLLGRKPSVLTTGRARRIRAPGRNRTDSSALRRRHSTK